MTITETRPAERTGDDEPQERTSTTSETVTKIVVGIVAVAAVIALVAHFGYGWNPGASPAPFRATVAAPAVVPEASPRATAPVASSIPKRITIPSITASSSLIALGLNPDQTLAVPPVSTPMQASWYDRSPTPGQIGPSVILGHVNGGGKPGIFADLAKVKPGQQVMVDRADGQTAVFTVSRVDLVPKDQFPTNQVYGDTPDAQLRLITCGGAFDAATRNYQSNVVAYATLTSVQPT